MTVNQARFFVLHRALHGHPASFGEEDALVTFGSSPKQHTVHFTDTVLSRLQDHWDEVRNSTVSHLKEAALRSAHGACISGDCVTFNLRHVSLLWNHLMRLLMGAAVISVQPPFTLNEIICTTRF